MRYDRFGIILFPEFFCSFFGAARSPGPVIAALPVPDPLVCWSPCLNECRARCFVSCVCVCVCVCKAADMATA